MREFKVVRVRCHKYMKMSDAVEIINNGPTFHRVFFEISDVNNSKIPFLTNYFHTVQNRSLSGEIRNVNMISNLDGNWIYENPNNIDSIFPEQLDQLARFANKANTSSCSGVMIGFDGVEWEKGRVIRGTYGYRKANSYCGARGFNYLSNSIIIDKDSLSGQLMCYVACEAGYRNTPAFQEMLGAFGKVIAEESLYAPTSEEERPEWRRRYSKAQSDFNFVVSGLQELYNRLPYPMSGEFLWPDEERALPTINTRKKADSALKSEGWAKADNIFNCGICYKKSMGDGAVIVLVDSTHRGHMLRINLLYCSEYFGFDKNINFNLEPVTEKDSENYFQNLLYVLRHIEDQLNAKR